MKLLTTMALLGAIGLSGCVMGPGPGNYVSSAVYSEGPTGDMRLESVTLGVTTPAPAVYVVPRHPDWRQRADWEREQAWREHEWREHHQFVDARDRSGPRVTISRPGKVQELR